MANSHVPKFGDWEDDDIPYTAFFDDARKDKPANNVRINPNDPEENPEAFMMMMQRRGPRITLEGRDTASDHIPHASVLQAAAAEAAQPPRRLIKSASTTDKPRHADEQTRRRRRSYHGNNSSGTNSSTSTSVGNNHKSPTSDSGSDQKTSSDYSLLHRPNQGRFVRSDDYKKKSTSTSSGRGSDSSSSATSEQGHRRRRSGSTNYKQQSSDHQHHHHRVASIPKFGSWDVNDPKSGEGFTFIFDKVKEEKQSNAVVKVPTMSPPGPPRYYNVKDRSKPGRITSCISKICCCMGSSGRE